MTNLIQIDAASFVTESEADGWEKGTVNLTLFGETRTVRAARVGKYGWTIAYGIEGMYRTGTKWWKGNVTLTAATGKISIDFGRGDNHPKFQKTNIRFTS